MIITPDDAYTFTRDGGYLDSRMPGQYRILIDEKTREYIRKMVALLITPWLETSEPGSFLELACGHGTYASFFVHAVTRYTGYDIYRPSLEEAARRLAGHSHCTLIHGDGRTLKETENDSQDFVFCFQALGHVPDDQIITGYIKEVCRVLSPRGVARLQIWGPNLRQGFHIGWFPLDSLALGSGGGSLRKAYRRFMTGLKKVLPPDFLLPRPMGSPPDHPVWKPGATLSPLKAAALVNSLGANAAISAVGQGGVWSDYWLTIYKDQAPFFLTNR